MGFDHLENNGFKIGKLFLNISLSEVFFRIAIKTHSGQVSYLLLVMYRSNCLHKVLSDAI